MKIGRKSWSGRTHCDLLFPHPKPTSHTDTSDQKALFGHVELKIISFVDWCRHGTPYPSPSSVSRCAIPHHMRRRSQRPTNSLHRDHSVVSLVHRNPVAQTFLPQYSILGTPIQTERDTIIQMKGDTYTVGRLRTGLPRLEPVHLGELVDIYNISTPVFYIKYPNSDRTRYDYTDEGDTYTVGRSRTGLPRLRRAAKEGPPRPPAPAKTLQCSASLQS